MAGLSTHSAAPIAAANQFRAVAWLRWRLFVNAFRRKDSTGETIARVLVYLVASVFVIAPSVAGFTLAYFSVSRQHPEFLAGMFWVILALQLLVSINIAPPAQTFDPQALIRYPLTFSRYLAIRLFLGLLSASTIIGTLALLAVATGITAAMPSLALLAYGACLAFALGNMLFIRMIFAWVDRWLATRRAREILTACIFVASIGFQYINVTVNNVGHHSSRAEQMARFTALRSTWERVSPALAFLPPSLAGSSVLHGIHGDPAGAALAVFALLVFAACFLAVFAWRMRREYRGENLSEGAKPQPVATPASISASRPIRVAEASSDGLAGWLSPPVSAAYIKEFLYVRRNPTQFYALIAPIAMVLIFAGRLGALSRGGFIFPAAVAYSVLGTSQLAYNLLGNDGSGVQFYFIAPIPFRSVMLGKNLFGFSVLALQFVLLYVMLAFSSGKPPVLMVLSTLCWVAMAALVNATVGNLRSIHAPRRVDPNKVARRQVSQLSILMCMGIVVVVAAVGAGVLALSAYLSLPWLSIPIFAALAVAAFAVYWSAMKGMDQLMLEHRETLIEELSKSD